MSEPVTESRAKQKLVASQIKGGFVDLLKDARALFPYSTTSLKVTVFFDSDNTIPVQINLTGWKHNTPMLTGLTQWFRRNNAKVGDIIEIRKMPENCYRLSFIGKETITSSEVRSSDVPQIKALKSFPAHISNSRHAKAINTSSSNFVIERSEGRVLVWSNQRLPFELKGELVELRNKIREGVRSLKSTLTPSALYGCYYSSEQSLVDTENVLFYNVGTSYFSHLELTSLMFERSFSEPPKPSQQGNIYRHFHYYSLEENTFKHWKMKEILIEFSATLPTSLNIGSSFRLEEVWFSIKNGRINVVNRLRNYASSQIGLNVRLTLPDNKLKLVSVMKSLIDGTISAFHRWENPDHDIIRIIADRLRTDTETVRNLLIRENESILGSRDLVHKWSNSIQWNPADDNLVAVKLSVECADIESIKISGEIYLTDTI